MLLIKCDNMNFLKSNILKKIEINNIIKKFNIIKKKIGNKI